MKSGIKALLPNIMKTKPNYDFNHTFYTGRPFCYHGNTKYKFDLTVEYVTVKTNYLFKSCIKNRVSNKTRISWVTD